MKIIEKKDNESNIITITEEMGEIILNHPLEEDKEIILEPGDKIEVINESEVLTEDTEKKDILETKPEILEKYKKKNEEDEEEKEDDEEEEKTDVENDDEEEDEVEEKKKKESTENTDETEKIDEEKQNTIILDKEQANSLGLQEGQKIKVM